MLIRERDGVCEGIVGFTTDYATDIDNIYCLQQDPHYRVDCTTRGYYQTPNPGFYLGYGMPRPQLPPMMMADEHTDVFGIESGNATVTVRDEADRVYAMPVKGQSLTLACRNTVEIWKGQQGTAVLAAAHAGDIYITEGTVSATALTGTVNLRARGTLTATDVDSIVCEGALNYEGCRLMPRGRMQVNRIYLPEDKQLYVELTPGTDVLGISPASMPYICGDITFSVGDQLPDGRYLLVEGACAPLDRCHVRGLAGRKYRLEHVPAAAADAIDRLYIVVEPSRAAATGVVWTGAESDVWDYSSLNFMLDGEPTTFVVGDCVVFDDRAVATTITVNEMMSAATVTFRGVDKEFALVGNGGISGRTILESGKLTVKEMNYTFEIGHATLVIDNSNVGYDNPLLLTDTATIIVPAGTVSLKGKVSGQGTLVKGGSGQLNITYAGANSWAATILQGGTLAMGAWNTTFGTSTSPIHVTGNATITMFNNNSSSQMPVFQNAVTIDRGATLTFHAGQRCSIKGKLYGEGTYKIDFPYVRGDVYTNCSEFEGVYHVTTTDCRFVQAMDLSKATLRIDNGAEVVSMKAGSGTAQSYTHRVGTIMGGGTLGNGTWEATGVTYSGGPTIVGGVLNLDSPAINVSAMLRGTVPNTIQLKVLTINGTVTMSGTPTFVPAVPKSGWVWDASTLATDGIVRITQDTGINDVECDSPAETVIYTLDGIRVNVPLNDPSLKGRILIVNGRLIRRF